MTEKRFDLKHILKKIDNAPYSYYYDDYKKPRKNLLNCSDSGIHNYHKIRRLTNAMMKEWYQMIERSLKYFFNSPSTIKNIFKYYKINIDHYNEKYYLIFEYNGKRTLIKEYPSPHDYWYEKLRIDLWVELGLTILEPTPIIPFPK